MIQKFIGTIGVLALFVAVPVFAQDGTESVSDEQVKIETTTDVRPSVREEVKDEYREKIEVMKAEIEEKRLENREEVTTMVAEKRAEMQAKMIERRATLTENAATRASSLEDLRKKREERRAELEDEGASTTPKFRNAVKNANEVRLAVHTLLASEGLVGGIGPRISEIAKHMNDTVGSTTDAEAQIESRGLLKKIFFGGDKTAADAIQQAVETNKENIAELNELLKDTTISTEVAKDLTAQIEVLEKSQERLTALAEKEGKRWGFFSWRFSR
jgi:hypothetical protein